MKKFLRERTPWEDVSVTFGPPDLALDYLVRLITRIHNDEFIYAEWVDHELDKFPDFNSYKEEIKGCYVSALVTAITRLEELGAKTRYPIELKNILDAHNKECDRVFPRDAPLSEPHKAMNPKMDRGWGWLCWFLCCCAGALLGCFIGKFLFG